MKLFKRNAIILTVILFVCVAVYLNWSYNRDHAVHGEDLGVVLGEDGTAAAAEPTADLSGLFYREEGEETGQPPVTEEVSDYFADARLARQQARDSAIGILREAAETGSASQDVIDRSLESINAMAGYSLAEAEIESLIRAKGFAECVVFLKDDSVTVTVPAPHEGLSGSAVSRITDIVLSETPLGYDQIKIIEVK
jgi:stage III sporulation protein AH